MSESDTDKDIDRENRRQAFGGNNETLLKSKFKNIYDNGSKLKISCDDDFEIPVEFRYLCRNIYVSKNELKLIKDR